MNNQDKTKFKEAWGEWINDPIINRFVGLVMQEMPAANPKKVKELIGIRLLIECVNEQSKPTTIQPSKD